ncbi:hypothetical protein ACG2F4_10455 [Halalkalibaculum sp. DA3122]|uniref:hypothetical protein n=1 Tax=Halalkalibaculum sp. DA3122 TaxID=3373607 RepID=UPI003753FA35
MNSPSNNLARIKCQSYDRQRIYPLANLVDIIHTRLNEIKSESSKGAVINEIIERTEIVSIKIHNRYRSTLSIEELKDYQKNLWQQLEELEQAEIKEGRKPQLEDEKRMFYYLFNYMDKIASSLFHSDKVRKLIAAPTMA